MVIEDEEVGYNFDYYGLPQPIYDPTNNTYEHPESTLVIDDDRGKYIRDEFTAGEFAYWYLQWSCNQHLKMKIKLPLKYMFLEVADIVDFDEIIGGVKPYGIDYSSDGEINGQQIFKTFLITETNKTLEFVEISCIQMHDLSFTAAHTPFDYTTFAGADDGTIDHWVQFAPILDSVSVDDIRSWLPYIIGINDLSGQSSTGYSNGAWAGSLTVIEAGKEYFITFSQDTTTNLVGLTSEYPV